MDFPQEGRRTVSRSVVSAACARIIPQGRQSGALSDISIRSSIRLWSSAHPLKTLAQVMSVLPGRVLICSRCMEFQLMVGIAKLTNTGRTSTPPLRPPSTSSAPNSGGCTKHTTHCMHSSHDHCAYSSSASPVILLIQHACDFACHRISYLELRHHEAGGRVPRAISPKPQGEAPPPAAGRAWRLGSQWCTVE